MSLNSVTNMFRSKSYSKFGSRDELCDDPSPSDDNVEVVDEENNFLSWPHDTRMSVQNDMSVNSNSTSNGDLSDTDDFGFGSKRDVHSRPRLWSNDEHTDYAPVSRDSRILSHRSENGHHGHIVSNPKTEVKELVNSFTQRRYQQLEESDESHESRNDNEGSQISDSDIENCVFHRVEDVHQNNKQKPAKPKKTKKIRKRTEKIVRRSWKWIRRGLIGYAQSFQFSNIFILTHTRK